MASAGPKTKSPAAGFFSDTDSASDHSTNSSCTQKVGPPRVAFGKDFGNGGASRKGGRPETRSGKPTDKSDNGSETSSKKGKEKWPLDESSRVGDFKFLAKPPNSSATQDTGSSIRETSSNNNATTSMEDFSFMSKPGSGDVMKIRSRKHGASSGESTKKRSAKPGSGSKNASKITNWRSMSPAMMKDDDGSKTPGKRVEVDSSAMMIGETVSAVRQMRTEAAILAFRLAEVHAQDAQELRQSATVMKGHVDSLNDEVQGMQAGLDELERSRWSWRTALREVGLFTAVMGAAIGAEEIARWIRNFASRPQPNSKPGSSMKGGVMGLAALVLVGARYKSPEWTHMAKSIRGNEQERQSLLEKWRAIIHRVAVMTSLAHSEPTSSGRFLDTETLPISNGGTAFALTR